MDEKDQADFLLSTFGIAAETPKADPTPDPVPPVVTPDPVSPVVDPVPPAVTDPADPIPPVVTPDPTPVDISKAESAFAALRVENKTYKQAVDGMAKLLGIDEKDPEKVAQAIQTKILEAQSKKDNVPVEILARLDANDADRATREAEARKVATNNGFAEVAKKFKLDEKGIEDFAVSLKNVGINPYEIDIDLPSMYILQNVDALIENAKKEGEAREAARLANVNNHSTTPNSNNGKPAATGTPINTVKGLDALFRDL